MSNIKKCVGKESFQRMNYLYQLSNQLAICNQGSHIASVHYSNLAVNISKKAVQRLDTEVKRTLCKGCRTLLIQGITCKVRIRKKKIVKQCLRCTTRKVFDTRNKNYMCWSQKKESLVELLDYTPKENKSSELNK